MLLSVRRLLGLVPSIAGGLASSLAVGYFLGWRTSVEYFSGFGAGWVVSLLSPVDLLQRSYGPLSALLIGMFFAVVSPASRVSNQKALYRTDLAISLSGVLLLGVVLVGGPYVGKTAAAIAGSLSSLLMSIGIGFTIVRWALERRDRKVAWGKRQLWFLYSIWLVAATQLPIAAGRAAGELAADPVLSTLPVARIDAEEWRLLLASGDRVVVARLFPNGKPIVKVVPAEKAESIREHQ